MSSLTTGDVIGNYRRKQDKTCLSSSASVQRTMIRWCRKPQRRLLDNLRKSRPATIFAVFVPVILKIITAISKQEFQLKICLNYQREPGWKMSLGQFVGRDWILL